MVIRRFNVLWAMVVRGIASVMIQYGWYETHEDVGKEAESNRDEMEASTESLATRDYSASGYSSRTGEAERRPETGNIEEAESSLREGGCLNYEEARALLGRLEYQKGNIEAALHVFDGIDIAAVIPKIKLSLARRIDRHRRRSKSDGAPPMSMHAVSLLFEAIFLKAKSLQSLGRVKEAAQSCKVLLDAVESALPEGLPENFGADCKLQDTLSKAVELLPELWKLAGLLQEAMLSYRRALLYQWNLDGEPIARIQKEFAIFLLYGGCDASPPNLRSQMESSFVPKNNIEEAVLLLLILLRKFALKRIEWDPTIIEHLTFALAVSGELKSLASHVEGLLPGVIKRRERYYTLALCYFAEGDDMVALNLLRKLLSHSENPNCIQGLLLASKICGRNINCAEEGVCFAKRALATMHCECNQIKSAANCLLGISVSSQARSALSDSERLTRQSEALQAMQAAERSMTEEDQKILFSLCLENADQRKLDTALHYAKRLIKLDAGANVRVWLLLARILSGQKQYSEAERIINAALDQTGKWNQGELLRTKAKILLAQGHLKTAVETYTHLLAVLQVRSKSFGNMRRLLKKKEEGSSQGVEEKKGEEIRRIKDWRIEEKSNEKEGRSKEEEMTNRENKETLFMTKLRYLLRLTTAEANDHRRLEIETWHDLANIYISKSQWRDAEVCLSRSRIISPPTASMWHATGLLYEAKGLYKEALGAFSSALEVDPMHIPSLISTAVVIRHLGGRSSATVRSYLMNALRLDRTNHLAWYNLGLHYKAEGSRSAAEAAECFQAAVLLEESAPKSDPSEIQNAEGAYASALIAGFDGFHVRCERAFDEFE
ncbi:hypothetical protein ACLOJK_011309 [Asimina triloba]